MIVRTFFQQITDANITLQAKTESKYLPLKTSAAYDA